MKQHEDIIKEIKKIIEEQFYGTGFDVAMGEYSSETGLSCIKENLLEKLDQLEQEQKDVEVIEEKDLRCSYDCGIDSTIMDVSFDIKGLHESDIDHIIIVKKDKEMCAPETFRKNDCADCEHYSTCSKPERGK